VVSGQWSVMMLAALHAHYLKLITDY
jgi:hypothetical protein